MHLRPAMWLMYLAAASLLFGEGCQDDSVARRSASPAGSRGGAATAGNAGSSGEQGGESGAGSGGSSVVAGSGGAVLDGDASSDAMLPASGVIDATTLRGKLLFGYQGWFG